MVDAKAIKASVRGCSRSLDNAPVGFQDSEFAFPFQMYDLLEDAERLGFKSVVSWTSNGMGFMVHNREAFTRRILPAYFEKQTRFRSFQRQLNFYLFERAKSGPEKDTYSHKYFIRGKRKLCHLITRKRYQGPGGNKSSKSTRTAKGILLGKGDLKQKLSSSRILSNNQNKSKGNHSPSSSESSLGSLVKSALEVAKIAGSKDNDGFSLDSIPSSLTTSYSAEKRSLSPLFSTSNCNDGSDVDLFSIYDAPRKRPSLAHELLLTSVSNELPGGEQPRRTSAKEETLLVVKSIEDERFSLDDFLLTRHGQHDAPLPESYPSCSREEGYDCTLSPGSWLQSHEKALYEFASHLCTFDDDSLEEDENDSSEDTIVDELLQSNSEHNRMITDEIISTFSTEELIDAFS